MRMGKAMALSFAAGVLLAGSAAWSAQPAEVPAQKLERIMQAAPEQAPARPAQPRKLLVYNNCGPKGFVHASIPLAEKVFEVLGQKTGAFEVVATSDPAAITPENLGQFDAIVMNNTSAECFLPRDFNDLSAEQKQAAQALEAQARQALLEFVGSGKGLIGLHGATDCYYRWPEYGKLIGGYFDGHPWNTVVQVVNEDPEHPVNAAFGGQGFEVRDEIYQFRSPYSRDNLRVLLRFDAERLDMSRKGIRRSDGDFAVSWIHTYGKGRVFYCALGHRDEIFWTPAILGHWLAGTQFALGDLPADTTPSAKLGRIPKPVAIQPPVEPSGQQ